MSPRAIGKAKTAPRAATGPLWDLPLYGPLSDMTTITPPETEIWGHLLSMTALPRFRVVARNHGLSTPDAKAAFPSARAFLLQAHDYYLAAKSVGERSAPLLHYYCLLNLAKFLISLSQPSRLVNGADLQHGLSVVRGAKSPRTAELESGRGIFSTLAEVLTGIAVPAHRIRVSDLIARCPDVSVEHLAAWGKPSSFTPCVLTELRDPASRTAWVRLTLVAGPMKPTWPLILRPGSYLRTNFTEVTKTPLTNSGIGDFQSNATVATAGRADDDVRADLGRMLRPLCLGVLGAEAELVRGARQRACGLPHFVRGKPPLPEPCVILAIAIYLSSVVRYSPFLFDDWQRSTDSWLVGTFARSGTAKFVRLALDISLRTTNIFRAL